MADDDEFDFITGTMTEIRRNWGETLQERFNPIVMALEMLQETNASRSHEAFMRLYDGLEEAMSIIVEKYYADFNSAVSIFGGIVDSTKLSCDHVASVRHTSVDFRDQIQFKRAELPELWAKVQLFKDRLAASGKIEQIARNRAKAEDMARRNFFIPAATLIADAISDAVQLSSKVPTADLLKSLEAQRSVPKACDKLFDDIVEKIHRLVYLKDKRYAQQLFSNLSSRIPAIKDLAIGALKGSAELSIDLTIGDLMVAPSEFAFEADANAVTFVLSLVRATSILGLLPQLLIVICQKIVAELFQMTQGAIAAAIKEYASLFLLPLSPCNDLLFLRAAPLEADPAVLHSIKRGSSESVHRETPCIIFLSSAAGAASERSIREEFIALSPILLELCQGIFARLLTVANCIDIIGQCATQISAELSEDQANDGSVARVQKSTSSFDIHAFNKNCLSAIHGEVCNLLSAILYGSTAGGRSSMTAKASQSSAIADALRLDSKRSKASSTKSTQPKVLYDFANASKAVQLPKVMGPSDVLSGEEEEAARKMAPLLAVDAFSTNRKDAGHSLPMRPNVQYVTTIYRAFSQFNAFLGSIFALNRGEANFADGALMSAALSDDYMPFVEEYFGEHLAHSFASNDALLWRSLFTKDQTLAIGRGANTILYCVAAFVDVFARISTILHLIPALQQECEGLLVSTFAQFMEKVAGKFNNMVTNRSPSSEATSTFVAISSTFVQSSDLRDVLLQHSMLTSGSESAGMNGVLAQKELLLLEALKGDRSLHRHEVIFDHRVIRSIALLQRSLEELPRILSDGAYGRDFVGEATVCGGGGDLEASHGRPSMRTDETGRLVSSFFDGVTRSVIHFSPAFEVQYRTFLETVNEMALTCLFTLRIELRVHCFYFLDLAYREGNYSSDEVSNEPDPYVSMLASDLIRYEALLAEWLPYSRYHMVMDQLAESLSGMLIGDLCYIRSLNDLGCRKLHMNVATLEQILSLINIGGPSNLSLVRDFYSIASCGSEKFIEMASGVRSKFTMEQYRSILDVLYRASPGDTSLDRTHSNQLVRLKYLLEGDGRALPGESRASP